MRFVEIRGGQYLRGARHEFGGEGRVVQRARSRFDRFDGELRSPDVIEEGGVGGDAGEPSTDRDVFALEALREASIRSMLRSPGTARAGRVGQPHLPSCLPPHLRACGVVKLSEFEVREESSRRLLYRSGSCREVTSGIKVSTMSCGSPRFVMATARVMLISLPNRAAVSCDIEMQPTCISRGA